MKIKKEKYESLRLELQKFVPQKYCVPCWMFDCIGDSSGEYFFSGTTTSYSNTYTNIHSNNGHPDIQIEGGGKPAQISGFVVDKVSGSKPHNKATKHPGFMYQDVTGNHFSTSGWERDTNNHS